jgi:hypothetical protein
MCHLAWLSSRKYGTVWYHPASSKRWYLTTLPFVNFQEKLTGTSSALCACEASFVRLAVCLALSALFASTAVFPLANARALQTTELELVRCQFMIPILNAYFQTQPLAFLEYFIF